MNSLLSTKISHFSEAVCAELGNYVYRLIDPRTGATFYVGKGKGNRLFDHINAALDFDEDEDQLSAKIDRIHEIRRCGLEVIHVVHRHGISDDAIYEVEAAVIDTFQGLSNIQLGHGSRDRGPMHAQQIIDKYDLPAIDWEPDHSLVLINVNRFEKSGLEALYNQTRFAWRMNVARAEKADYVLSVMRGVVIGAFKADSWKPSTREHFPELSEDIPGRYGFSGTAAPEAIWDLYCGKNGKRIALPALRHVQNPIRYWRV